MHILYLSNWAATYVSFTYFLTYLLYWYFQTLDQMDMFLEDECSHIAERWSKTLKKNKNSSSMPQNRSLLLCPSVNI